MVAFSFHIHQPNALIMFNAFYPWVYSRVLKSCWKILSRWKVRVENCTATGIINPGTAIQFNLGRPGNGRLSVFGREVATLVNETRHSDLHTVVFEASQMSAGIYLYKLQTDEQRITRKMLLVK